MQKTFMPFGPFIFSQLTIFKKNIVVILLLFIQIIILGISKEYIALLNIIISISAVLFASFVACRLNREIFHLDISNITLGIIIGLCIPISNKLALVGILIFLSVFIVKFIFGGNGSNWVNPIAFTICVIYITAPEIFPTNLNNISLITTNGNMFALLQVSDVVKIKNDPVITSVLNSFLHTISVVLPDGYVSLMTNYTSSIPSFRYNLIILMSSIFLFAFDVVEKIIPTMFLVTYGILVWLFSMFPINETIATGDMLTALCTSGTLFFAFFILSETASTPSTSFGKVIFGIITGIFAFLIVGPGGSSIGMAFVVLLGNIFSPVIENIENNIINYKLRKNYGR